MEKELCWKLMQSVEWFGIFLDMLSPVDIRAAGWFGCADIDRSNSIDMHQSSPAIHRRSTRNSPRATPPIKQQEVNKHSKDNNFSNRTQPHLSKSNTTNMSPPEILWAQRSSSDEPTQNIIYL
jgi:hypothetical protein